MPHAGQGSMIWGSS